MKDVLRTCMNMLYCFFSELPPFLEHLFTGTSLTDGEQRFERAGS